MVELLAERVPVMGRMVHLDDPVPAWWSCLAEPGFERQDATRPGGGPIGDFGQDPGELGVHEQGTEFGIHIAAGRRPNYFATRDWTEEWAMDGQTALMRFWHRPLHAMTDAFTAAGFRITVISEPAPARNTPRDLLPDDFADRRAFLCFLFFVLQAS